jgi:hypothetical protein
MIGNDSTTQQKSGFLSAVFADVLYVQVSRQFSLEL